jgi:hypothetical protein
MRQTNLRRAFVCLFSSILLLGAYGAAASLSAAKKVSQSGSTIYLTPEVGAPISAAAGSSALSTNTACPTMAVARITARVDDNVRSSLSGNLHPMARAEYDQGRVDDNLRLEHIILQLRRTPEQEAALSSRIDQMHNRRSPLYHQWLRAQDVGRCYGAADPDIATVSAWLQKHGFTIDSVPAGKMLIIFSGTAGQIRETFGTEIHNLNVRGERHIANMSEPQIPAALVPVITGFRSLNDFFSHSNMRTVGPVQRDSTTGTWHLLSNTNHVPFLLRPNSQKSNPLDTFSLGGQSYYAIGPQDLYTIYNETPLLTGSTPINGAGETLAVIERSDITEADVGTFRSQFALPTYPATPDASSGGVNFMTGVSGFCSDPGIVSGDEGEADLDIDWIGVTAPNAIIDYVSCASTSTSDGTDLSLTYVINSLSDTVSAMSSSYGGCEPAGGTTEEQFYASLFGQAVAQGQTVVVAAGDSGSDACDRGNGDGPNSGQDLGETGISVQSQSSSQYAVAAGGSDFSDIYQNNTTNYWGLLNGAGFSSALSYIPEMAWNNTCSDTLLVDYYAFNDGITYSNGPEGLCNDTTNFSEEYPFTTLGGGTGGVSLYVTPLPTWQSVYGVGLNFTSTAHRNLPDISLYAAIGLWNHFLLYCQSEVAPCDYSNTTDAFDLGVGGTSAVAPMLTGIIGLINEAWPSGVTGQPTRQGQPNYTFYALATSEYGSSSSENTSTTAPSAYTCEGSNLNAVGTYSSIFSSCNFQEINRTSELGSSSCLASDNTGCLVDNNGGACAKGTPNCYTNTSSDPYGILSVSTSTFESAYNQSGGYSAATGLGSLNIANLVNNWTSVTPQFASTTGISATPTSLFTTTTTALTATVTATGRGGIAPPLGDVSFYTGSSCTGTAVGTAPLVPASGCTTSCNSTATLSGVTGAQLGGAGTDSVIACFNGDGANDAPSTSSGASFTVTQTALSLSSASTSVSITGGQQGTVQLTLSSNAALSSTPTLACSGLPSDASCSFSSVSSLPATITMTITTTSADAQLLLPGIGPKRHISSWLMLGLLLPGLLLVLPRKSTMRKPKIVFWCGVILMLMLAWVGCGGGSSSSSGSGSSSQQGSQNYTVTVTASSTGATSGTASVQVTVTQ